LDAITQHKRRYHVAQGTRCTAGREAKDEAAMSIKTFVKEVRHFRDMGLPMWGAVYWAWQSVSNKE
jgi:hypothetical protein